MVSKSEHILRLQEDMQELQVQNKQLRLKSRGMEDNSLSMSQS